MATLLLTAAASAFASSAFVGGLSATTAALATGAANIGAAVIGGVIDNALFGPTPPDTEGPRLSNPSVSGSGEGSEIPLIYGTMRVAGTLIWQTNFTEIEDSEEVGGKGSALGGGGATQTTFEYTASFACLITRRQITSVDEIYADGQILDLDTMAGHIVYDGTQTMPDPTYAATETLAPAFIGQSYAVFEDVSLNQFSNRIPEISFLVTRDVGGTVRGTLEAIAEDFGLDIDASLAPTTGLHGWIIERGTSGRNAVATLASVYHLDLAPMDNGVMKIVPRQQEQPDYEIQEDDLLSAITYRRDPVDNAPGVVDVSYYDRDRGYQTRTITERRGEARNPNRRSIPSAMTAAEASQIALSGMEEAERNRETVEVQIRPSDVRALRPGSFLNLIGRDGFTYRTKISDISDEWEGRLTARMVDGSLSEPTLQTSDISIAQLYREPQVVSLAFLDLPILLGEEHEHTPHVVAYGEGWRGAVLYRSPTGANYSSIASLNSQGTVGTVTNPINSGPEWDVDGVLDTQTATVVLASGSNLNSASAAQLDAGANAAAITDISGNQEIVQFMTANLAAENTYEISGLRRAIRGTDGQMIHSAGSQFVLINSSVTQVYYPLEQRGQSAFYRYGPATRAVDDPLYLQATRSFAGVGLRPYSPINLAATRQGGGDLTITWTRRDRKGFDPSGATPMSEMLEEYDVVIVSGAGRTLKSDSESVTYTSADQTADGLTLTATTIGLEVFQISQTFGRGTGRRETVNIT